MMAKKPFVDINQRLRTIGGMVFFLLVVSATFYPFLSAALFGKTITKSIDSREVLSSKASAQVHIPSGVFKNPVITIAFDDGWESTYKYGLPVLDKLDFKATFYILSDSFSDMQYMSVAQVTSLKDQGHQIGSHTISHPNLSELSQTDLRYELMGSQRQLSAKFGQIQDFASPYGGYNDDTIAEIQKLYRSHRTVTAGVNTFENYDIYRLKSPNIKITTTTEEVAAWIEQAKSNNGWLILTYHEINDSDREYSTAPKLFEEQMQLIKDSGIPVATLEKVLDEIKETYEQS